MPKAVPKSVYHLTSPLVNRMENMKKSKVNAAQNTRSSIVVNILFLKSRRKNRKMSYKNPTNSPKGRERKNSANCSPVETSMII